MAEQRRGNCRENGKTIPNTQQLGEEIDNQHPPCFIQFDELSEVNFERVATGIRLQYGAINLWGAGNTLQHTSESL
jgi:hypothetical protein